MLIQNVSYEDIEDQNYKFTKDNCALIQIVDADTEFPDPRDEFKNISRYIFADSEIGDPNHETSGITKSQAANIIRDLNWAKIHNMDVIVHCMAGLCRSGAVVEAAIAMGFEDPETFRAPNIAVAHMLMQELGLDYIQNDTEY